jgi:fructose-bisphosphate aldolase class I
MDSETLRATARALVARGKGILAADESTSTIAKRLASVQVESTVQNRRAYRELLFTTPGMEAHISGVILYDETIRQASKDGVPFSQLLAGKGVIPGIKVDKGVQDLPGFPGEKITEGLDGLRGRCAEYHGLGARFAKWRAVISIAPGLPTRYCLEANAHALARYAALSQEAGLVPIVEPEVLMDGDHDIARCAEVTEATLRAVFAQLQEHRVSLEGMLLKPNMVLPGVKCPRQADVAEVAERTIESLRRVVPAAVPGVVFLSGGQSSELATAHLNAMNQMGGCPWELSFSYGRALQDAPLKAWRGNEANAPQAQRLLYHRARLNGIARDGLYSADLEAQKD